MAVQQFGAIIVFKGEEHLQDIKQAIGDVGYEATLDNVAKVGERPEPDTEREVAIHIDGMHREHCPARISEALNESFGNNLHISKLPTTSDPILGITYTPRVPDLTIRQIIAAIAAIDVAFEPSIYHPSSLEQRSQAMRAREQRRILLRLALSVAAAIPTFVLGIVLLTLVDPSDPSRRFVMEPIWAGSVSRAEWALFIMATPVYFFAADVFHVRALKELRAMWRPGAPPLCFAGKLRPTETMLVDPLGSPRLAERRSQSGGQAMRKIPVDLLECGDTVKVFHGGAPPSDGVIIEGETQFDESSLTGESRLVAKHNGDQVFAGTVNRGSPISVRISNVAGTSMLDQIVKVVREGQARRAPVERVADLITSHFVPLVVLLGVFTWIIWLALGLSGSLPESYRDTDVGGWPLWSLQFSIAVFVIACPCGIGLAAPTAFFVGGGLAARHGILVKGGGEAFQEASGLDCVVFDKTGTLTEAEASSVTDYECLSAADETRVLGMVRSLEETPRVNIAHITEIPGKGMRGIFSPSPHNDQQVEVILGNEALMSDYEVKIDYENDAVLGAWKAQGKSVALFAMKAPAQALAEEAANAVRPTAWKLSAVFAASDKLRPEAAAVVAALQSRGIEVWMISGDNPATASTVGKMVGISEKNVIAGVLPDQKAEKIQHLQKNSAGQGSRGPRNRWTVAMVRWHQ
ncbi:hypothetical protein MMC16_001312 [Acarospora aff. strigata]|nr:hypothetical protein [Acarospora aff. strigata]